MDNINEQSKQSEEILADDLNSTTEEEISILTEENENLKNRSGIILNIENFNNYTEKDIEQLAYELEFYRQKISMGKGGVWCA